MFVVRLDSPEGKRLAYEGRVLARGLRRVVKASGGKAGGLDQDAEKLNFDLGLDIVGLVALRARVGAVAVTLLSAPGAYFDPSRPERRLPLDRLAAERRGKGRRTLVVTKHEIIGRTAFDLAGAVYASPTVQRRNPNHSLVSTGRRSPETPRLNTALSSEPRGVEATLAEPEMATSVANVVELRGPA